MTSDIKAADRAAEDALIEQYIDADVMPKGDDRAEIRGMGVPVWVLVATYRLTLEEDGQADPTAVMEQIADGYNIPSAAVAAALAYAQRSPAIDWVIGLNTNY